MDALQDNQKLRVVYIITLLKLGIMLTIQRTTNRLQQHMKRPSGALAQGKIWSSRAPPQHSSCDFLPILYRWPVYYSDPALSKSCALMTPTFHAMTHHL